MLEVANELPASCNSLGDCRKLKGWLHAELQGVAEAYEVRPFFAQVAGALNVAGVVMDAGLNLPVKIKLAYTTLQTCCQCVSRAWRG